MSEPRAPLRALLRESVDARQVAAVWQRVEARRRRPARAQRGMLLAFAGCAAVLGLAMSLHVGPGHGLVARDAHAVDHAPGRVPAGQAVLRWAGGAALSAVETRPSDARRVVQLSDGTRIALEPGTRLVPREVSSARAGFALERGVARFEVAPQGERRFEVSAGPLRVTVVGTAFTISAGTLQTRVAVEHGRVRVESPAGERMLGAGQSWQWPEPTAAAASAARQSVTAVGKSTPPANEPTRSEDVARGAELPSAQQLLQLSDGARAAGRPAEAARALERLLQLHAADPQASLAALTLARLRLDTLAQPQAAVRALRRALALGLPQALQEDALATLVRAHRAAGDRESTALAAQRYLASYPQGRFAAEIERWAAAP